MNSKIKSVLVIAVLTIGLILSGTNVYASTGKILNDSTRMRKEASTKSGIVEEIAEGNTVEIISEKGEWYKVKYRTSSGIVEGYIRKDLIKVEGKKTPSSEKKEETTSDKTETSSEKKEETKPVTLEKTEESKKEVSEKEEESSSTVTETTGAQEANTTEIEENSEIELSVDTDLKVIPLVFASKNGTIAKNSKITVTEIIGNWCHVENEEKDGWVLKSKLESSINQANTKTEEKKDEIKKEETKKEETKKEETTKKTNMYVSTTILNLREKANATSKVLTQLDQNDKVTVLEKVDNTWSKVSYKNYTGYVATEYLSNKKVEVTSRASQEPRTNENDQNNETNTNNSNNENRETTKKETTTTKNRIVSVTETNNNKSTSSSKTSTKSSSSKTTTNTASTNSSKATTSKKETSTKKEETTKKSSSKVSGSDIVAYAKKFLGCRYVYGTAGPKTFDCSGLTSYVYKHFGYTLSRTSGAQRSNGKSVKKSDLQAGDIVCFSGHVGIYIGGNKFIHAANPRKGVIITSLSESYYVKTYITARRIL